MALLICAYIGIYHTFIIQYVPHEYKTNSVISIIGSFLFLFIETSGDIFYAFML